MYPTFRHARHMTPIEVSRVDPWVATHLNLGTAYTCVDHCQTVACVCVMSGCVQRSEPASMPWQCDLNV